MILLDTNVVSEVMRPAPEPSVMQWLREQPLRSLAISSVTLAEIHYSLARIPDSKRQLDLTNRFRLFVEAGFGERVFAFDEAAASEYGPIVAAREKAGRRIETFDAMIAATALTRKAKIATRDISGFQDCGVEIINPWEA